VGYLLRNTANVYVATLALVAGPTVVGQFAGVAMVSSPMSSRRLPSGVSKTLSASSSTSVRECESVDLPHMAVDHLR